MASRIPRASSAPAGTVTQTFSLQPATDPTADDKKPSFWEMLFSVSDDDWWDGVAGHKGTRVYLYNDTPGQKASYIAAIAEPFDIDWVKQEYGGGNYRAQLNDPSGRCLSSVHFSIDGAPKRKTVQPDNPPPSTADPFQSQVLAIISDGQRRTEVLLERLIDRGHPPGQSNGGIDAATQFKAMMDMFSHLAPRPVDPIEQFLKLKELLGAQDPIAQLVKFKELGLIGGGGGMGNILAELDLVMKVAERMGIVGGNGGGNNIPALLLEKGPEILSRVVEGLGKYREVEAQRLETARFIASHQPRQPIITPAPGAPPPPAVATPAPAAAPQASPLQVEPIAAAPRNAAEAAEMTEAMLNQLKARVVQCIVQGMNGRDIFGFLNVQAPAFLEGMVKRDGAGNITGIVTEQELAIFCSTDPILSQATQSPRFKPAIQELLEELADFVGLGEDEPEDAPDGRV